MNMRHEIARRIIVEHPEKLGLFDESNIRTYVFLHTYVEIRTRISVKDSEEISEFQRANMYESERERSENEHLGLLERIQRTFNDSPADQMRTYIKELEDLTGKAIEEMRRFGLIGNRPGLYLIRDSA